MFSMEFQKQGETYGDQSEFGKLRIQNWDNFLGPIYNVKYDTEIETVNDCVVISVPEFNSKINM